MATATTRMTVGSVLGVVQTTADTLSSTLNAVAQGVNMANAYVSNAAEQQQLRIKKDKVTFIHRLAEEHSMETALRQVEVAKFCKDPENEKFYRAAYDEIMEALAPTAKPTLSAVA